MWKDINGKRGYKNMQGDTFLYGNMKLLSVPELAYAFSDGVKIHNRRPVKLQSDESILLKAKSSKLNLINQLFNAEALKSIDVDGVVYNGGYEAVSRIDAVRRLIEMSNNTEITLFDIDNKPVTLTPEEVKTVIISLGVNYQTLFTIKQSLKVDVESATTFTEVEDVKIPWALDLQLTL